MSEFLLQLAGDVVWQGVLLTAAGWGACRLLRHHPARLRARVWLAVLVLPAALPFLPQISPGQPVVSLPSAVAAPATSAAVAPVTLTAIADPTPAIVPLAAPTPRLQLRPAARQGVLLLYGWAAISALLIAGLLLDLLRVKGVKRRASPIRGQVATAMHASRAAAGVRRRVRFLESGDVAGAAFVGFVRPAVLFPRPVSALPVPGLEAVLAHELAHLERRDDWQMLLQRLMRALFFFSPAVHVAGRRLALEREIACDEWALERTGLTPRHYSATLLRAAERALARQPLALVSPMAGSRLHRRIRHLLELERGAPGPRGRMRARLALILLPAAATVGYAVPGLSISVSSAAPAERSDDATSAPAVLADAFDALETAGYRGAVLVTQDGSVLLERGFGAANPRTGRRNEPGTAFNAGAAAKSFTAAAILLLEREGRLSVEDPLSRWFGPLPAPKDRITLHHLLTHTSGLTRRDAPVFADSRDAFVEGVRRAPADFEPGSRQRFTDIGYSALAAVVEIASGMTYEEYVRSRFLEPLGLTTTWFDSEAPRAPVAVEYARTFDRGSAVGARAYTWGRRGAMGVSSTVGDLMRWQRALPGLFDPAQLRRLYGTTSHDDRGVLTGYGWETRRTARGTTTFTALSGWPGNSVEMMHEPETGLAVVLFLDNRVDWDAPRSEAIARLLEGDATAARDLLRRIGEW